MAERKKNVSRDQTAQLKSPIGVKSEKSIKAVPVAKDVSTPDETKETLKSVPASGDRKETVKNGTGRKEALKSVPELKETPKAISTRDERKETVKSVPARKEPVKQDNKKRDAKSTSLGGRLRGNAFGRFVYDAYYELRHKVTWPTYREARNMTLVVIALSAVIGGFLALVDFGFHRLFLLIIGAQ
jgi:preprotein translocase SecE subunit